MSMYDQFGVIVKIDILVGMYGVGLILVLFFLKYVGFIELYLKYWFVDNVYFKVIVSWCKLYYIQW